jgi:hypothetical protein
LRIQLFQSIDLLPSLLHLKPGPLDRFLKPEIFRTDGAVQNEKEQQIHDRHHTKKTREYVLLPLAPVDLHWFSFCG